MNQKLPVEVMSYDADLDQVVPRKIVNWFDNGRTESFFRVTTARGGGNGRSQFACTPNHMISTPGGWRPGRGSMHWRNESTRKPIARHW